MPGAWLIGAPWRICLIQPACSPLPDAKNPRGSGSLYGAFSLVALGPLPLGLESHELASAIRRSEPHAVNQLDEPSDRQKNIRPRTRPPLRRAVRATISASASCGLAVPDVMAVMAFVTAHVSRRSRLVVLVLRDGLRAVAAPSSNIPRPKSGLTARCRRKPSRRRRGLSQRTTNRGRCRIRASACRSWRRGDGSGGGEGASDLGLAGAGCRRRGGWG